MRMEVNLAVYGFTQLILLIISEAICVTAIAGSVVHKNSFHYFGSRLVLVVLFYTTNYAISS